MVCVCALLADFALARLLQTLLKNGEFGISFRGMEQNLNLGQMFAAVQRGETNLASLKLEGDWLTRISHFLLLSSIAMKTIPILAKQALKLPMPCASLVNRLKALIYGTTS